MNTRFCSAAHPRSRGENLSPPPPSLLRAAHPRSRGENATSYDGDGHTDGSSPLTRGKLHQAEAGLSGVRLIPAHAGKTTKTATFPPSVRAHPRSRGENDGGIMDVALSPGSSPLTRGKQRRRLRNHGHMRLIPAHAGKTQAQSSQSPIPSAHPRSRGENSYTETMSPSAMGSSPLTRGKLRPGTARRRRTRLIPAHAGKTHGSYYGTSGVPAHPRSRGENRLRLGGWGARGGSSPLTRGKHCARACCHVEAGLIPAHAGKTPGAYDQRAPGTAHPRSRGENATSGQSWGLGVGSSPLTRGKPQQLVSNGQLGRLIPAHAGKTPGSGG